MWQLRYYSSSLLLCIIVLAIGFVFGVIVTLLMRIDGKKSKGTKKKELSDTEKASQDDVVKQPSSSANEEHDAMCYVCHGTGADESGQPLRRDCACRGTDGGFFHLACLTGLQHPKVCDGMVAMNSLNRGKPVLVAIMTTKTSLQSISQPSFSCSSEGSIHMMKESSWSLST